MEKKDKLIITIEDYERIFQVIHSVFLDIDKSKVPSCQFYNSAAAIILKKFYNIEALPIMGFATFYFDNVLDIGLYLGHMNWQSSINAFHCWVHTKNYFLDFTAPLYREYLEKAGSKYPLPRKMFQKKIEQMSLELEETGDFYAEPNLELTQSQLKKVLDNPLVSDAFDICLNWFKKPPQIIEPIFPTADQFGNVININLTDIKLSEAW